VACHNLEERDIQAIAWTAFDSLNGASYLLLRIVHPVAARAWLRDQTPASLADVRTKKCPVNECAAKSTAATEETSYVSETLQIAFTAAGLRKLGLDIGHDKGAIPGFPLEFLEGVTGSENRSRRLGDIGANAPEYWDWGIGEKEPHVLVILLASKNRIASYATAVRATVELSGFSTVASLPTTDMGGVEPFGFKDGASQPSFDWDGRRKPGTAADRDYTNEIALGELLLGYRNEYGLFTERPLLAANEKNAEGLLPLACDASSRPDLGLNGTYLVYRQLSQDVPGFWRWVAGEAARVGTLPEKFAEAMVGRRLDGCPLQDSIVREIPGIDPDHATQNGFTFDTDPHGLSCPIGAHIRRANPRTGDLPGGRQGALDSLLAMLGLNGRPRRGETSATRPWPQNHTIWPGGRAEGDAIASARFHRLLRRGREYGKKITRDEALDPAIPDPQAGLHFICLNANIARQFEFVQGAWIASTTFGALSGEQDPLLGNREPFPKPPISPVPQRTDSFSRPGAEPTCRHSVGLPGFVTVRGGAYFFLPGLRALKWIAAA
jgi:deferrochelatase/peroxidase EfeB